MSTTPAHYTNDSAKACDADGVCWAMSSEADADGEPKGLAIGQFFSMATGDFSGWVVMYRRKARARGTLVNHCPWCGGIPGEFAGDTRRDPDPNDAGETAGGE
ncbi:hypothetical protein H8E07_10115 [bacterium]|nr:hypothetical protein [bacterium]